MKSKVKEAIKIVAQDAVVQRTVLNAMFNGCERGTDIFESLGSSSSSMKEETRYLIWGKQAGDKETDKNALYAIPDTAKCLIDEVQRFISHKI